MNAGGKSKVTVTGLTSGIRYWFRVVAEGAGGPGPSTDIATKVAPQGEAIDPPERPTRREE